MSVCNLLQLDYILRGLLDLGGVMRSTKSHIRESLCRFAHKHVRGYALVMT